jgi:hypothetical protein
LQDALDQQAARTTAASDIAQERKAQLRARLEAKWAANAETARAHDIDRAHAHNLTLPNGECHEPERGHAEGPAIEDAQTKVPSRSTFRASTYWAAAALATRNRSRYWATAALAIATKEFLEAAASNPSATNASDDTTSLHHPAATTSRTAQSPFHLASPVRHNEASHNHSPVIAANLHAEHRDLKRDFESFRDFFHNSAVGSTTPHPRLSTTIAQSIVDDIKAKRAKATSSPATCSEPHVAPHAQPTAAFASCDSASIQPVSSNDSPPVFFSSV